MKVTINQQIRAAASQEILRIAVCCFPAAENVKGLAYKQYLNDRILKHILCQ